MKHVKPGRGPSAMGAFGAIIAVIFGIFWTVSTASMGAPAFFPIFGVLFIIIGIVQYWSINHRIGPVIDHLKRTAEHQIQISAQFCRLFSGPLFFLQQTAIKLAMCGVKSPRLR